MLFLHVASHAFGVCDGVNIVKLCVSCSGDQLDARLRAIVYSYPLAM